MVEGGRVSPDNPFLNVSNTRSTAVALSEHAANVAGIIASSHGTHRGMASAIGSNSVDFIMVDGNHWGAGTREHYRVHRFNGSGAYTINAANLSSIDPDNKGTYGPFTMDAYTALSVFDIGYRDRSLRRFRLMPAIGSTSADLAMALYRSSAGDSTTWARGRSSSVTSADGAGTGGTERMRYRFDGTTGDRLGLAVHNKNFDTPATFYLRVTPSSLFSDGFNGD